MISKILISLAILVFLGLFIGAIYLLFANPLLLGQIFFAITFIVLIGFVLAFCAGHLLGWICELFD